MDAAEAVDALKARGRQAAVSAGLLLTAILDVADTATKGFDADEVAFALTWTSSGVQSQLRQARYFRDVMPSVLAALCTGEIDSYQAWVFFDVLFHADDQVAAMVVERVLPQASELTGPQLRRKLRRELYKLDPMVTPSGPARPWKPGMWA